MDFQNPPSWSLQDFLNLPVDPPGRSPLTQEDQLLVLSGSARRGGLARRRGTPTLASTSSGPGDRDAEILRSEWMGTSSPGDV